MIGGADENELADQPSTCTTCTPSSSPSPPPPPPPPPRMAAPLSPTKQTAGVGSSSSLPPAPPPAASPKIALHDRLEELMKRFEERKKWVFRRPSVYETIKEALEIFEERASDSEKQIAKLEASLFSKGSLNSGPDTNSAMENLQTKFNLVNTECFAERMKNNKLIVENVYLSEQTMHLVINLDMGLPERTYCLFSILPSSSPPSLDSMLKETLKETLKPFEEKASNTERQIANLEALLSNKDGLNSGSVTSSAMEYFQSKFDLVNAECLAEKKKNKTLTTENRKLRYRISHLIQAADEADLLLRPPREYED